MKSGEPPPKGVQELILKLAGSKPRLTNREIRETVTRKFGEEIELSDRTICRYCKAAGLPTSSREAEGMKPKEVPVANLEETPDIGQEFRVWCGSSNFRHVRLVSVEHIPPSSRSVVDFGTIEAGTEVTSVAVNALGIEPGVLARLKIEVLENVAVTLVEPNAESPTSGQGLGHEVDTFTPSTGPGAEGTWFWLYGKNKELSIRVRNPMGYRTPISRVRFFGWRAVTEPVNRPRGPVVEAVSRAWT